MFLAYPTRFSAISTRSGFIRIFHEFEVRIDRNIVCFYCRSRHKRVTLIYVDVRHIER